MKVIKKLPKEKKFKNLLPGINVPQTIETRIQEIATIQAETEKEPTIVEIERQDKQGQWDVDKNMMMGDQVIDYFDPTLSYEITGYRPINATQGLDFDPSWFTKARDTKTATGKYTDCHYGTKAYRDFWHEEYIRCRNGYTVNGYTITGDHYFFLNYYQLLLTQSTKKAAGGRSMGFPNFLVAQYEYLHYIELCKQLRQNAALMKARGLGFSEMNASIAANLYSTTRGSMTIITANQSGKLTPTLRKLWAELSFLNDRTDGGFFKLRQVVDKTDNKRASHYKIINGQKTEEGWMSEIRGITADSPDKIRGERAELLIFEEAGSWPNLKTAVIQGRALIGILGNQFGIELIGGTGGDSGAALEGLHDIYYNPKGFNVLPLKHRFTADGQYALTGYFLPAYSILIGDEYTDHRGWTDPEKAKAFYQKERDVKSAEDPKGYPTYCAEYCFTAEEAFALEGENKFNKVYLVNQLAQINLYKAGPKLERGDLQFVYSGGRELKHVVGVKWIPDPNGPIVVAEKPLWETSHSEVNDAGDKIEVSYKEMRNLYVAGIDGIDIGESQTSDATKDPSKFCIVVKKRAFGNQIPMYVAYYLDRPWDERKAYQTALKLMMWYNCRGNVEASRLSVFSFAKTNGFSHFFINRPRATYPNPNQKISPTVGTPATKAIITHQTDLIANYVEDSSEQIWFPEMLEQLIRYTDENKGKFDIVAAMGMAELADEELSGIVPTDVEDPLVNEWKDIGYYRDEYGKMQYGIIEKSPIQIPNFNLFPNNDDPTRVRSSNPRYNTEYVS